MEKFCKCKNQSGIYPARGIDCGAIHYIHEACDSEYCTLYKEVEHVGPNPRERQLNKAQMSIVRSTFVSLSNTKKRSCWGCGYEYLEHKDYSKEAKSGIEYLTKVGRNYFCPPCLDEYGPYKEGKKKRKDKPPRETVLTKRQWKRRMKDIKQQLIDDGHELCCDVLYDLAEGLLSTDVEISAYMDKHYSDIKKKQAKVEFLAEEIGGE